MGRFITSGEGETNDPLKWRYEQHRQLKQLKPLVLSPYFMLLRWPVAWANECHPSGRESCWCTGFLTDGLGLLLRTLRGFLGELGAWGVCPSLLWWTPLSSDRVRGAD